MENSVNRQHLPDIDLLSILAAMIVLAYTLERFINLPGWQISRQFPGLYIEVNISVSTITSLLVAGMTAAGNKLVTRYSPRNAWKSMALQHAILPALTAMVIGLPLSRVPVGLGWWLGLISGAFILVLVIIAEFIAVDPGDKRFSFANAALSAISFALFLVLAGILSGTRVRLLFVIPAIMIATWLVSLRVI